MAAGRRFVDAPTSNTAAIASCHRGGHTAFVQVDQPFRRDFPDALEELFATLAVCFRVPLDGVERLFSAADPTVLTTAGPSTNSSLRRGRGRVVRVTRLPSDPDAPQPEWRSGRTLPELDGSSVRACSAPARAVRSPAAGGRSSPHTQDSRRTPPPASGNFHAPWRAPQISCAAGRPRRLSPSSSSSQSRASSTLHHHCYCFKSWVY